MNEIKCRCVNCGKVAFILSWESSWTCYQCGRIQSTERKRGAK